MLSTITLPPDYQYVGVFLTLACNLTCSYCINHLSGDAVKKRYLRGQDFVALLNRLELPKNVPLTLQGGEPTIHPHFYEIVSGLRPELPIDLLTNLQFDPQKFAQEIDPKRFERSSPYPAIRVTYHPETMRLKETLEKAAYLQDKGFPIGLYGILHPRDKEIILKAQSAAKDRGLDFRTKEFLGLYGDEVFGQYRYPDAVFSETTKNCWCKTSELLIDPGGIVFRCHHDLYNKVNPQGSLLDDNFRIKNVFLACDKFGKCNPCDVKVKNNHLQQFGHTSVEILFQEPT